MSNNSGTNIAQELKFYLFELKQSERLWHIPVLASLCVGIPLFVGYYFGRLDYSILASTGGLVILYLPSTSLANRMLTLLVCSFGFVISFAVGISFSFNPIMSSVVLGLYTLFVHWVAKYFAMKPPGNFFFVMLACIASASPFDLASIPTRIGLIAMGTIFSCVLAFFYSLLMIKKHRSGSALLYIKKNAFTNLVESAVVGMFIGGSFLIGHLLELENPYWVPISCLAVMQGVNTRHIWQRSLHRILGTFVGLGLTWLLISQNLTALGICVSILVLQFIIEMLVVRHYGLAVVFITPMTIFLAEASSAMTADPNALVYSRFQDILVGSLIGAVGGWVLYHQKLRYNAVRQLRKTRVAILRRQPNRSV
ncbi:FUSC family protein [Pontibacter ramchanderi]|uniref:Fusaric acid resistance family protein n=1 Tax=Pontibacter ramchanderi TaxID=1179743 RepID=A0A2N3UAH0_9BACT|nr:FUSC family protein [Pontibacter ramchanderi]PKV66356.1 fusaric acid resistance family protein [Pontibacter ramchanderi]